MKLRQFSLLCLFISIPTSFIGGVLSIRFLVYTAICLIKAEYLKYFESVGWHLACKNYCFYVFHADDSAPPLHTDKTFHEQIKEQWTKKMFPRAILFLAIAIGFIILGKASVPSWLQLLSFPLTVISGGLSIIFGYASISLIHIHDNHHHN